MCDRATHSLVHCTGVPDGKAHGSWVPVSPVHPSQSMGEEEGQTPGFLSCKPTWMADHSLGTGFRYFEDGEGVTFSW